MQNPVPKSKIILVTHYMIYSAAQALGDYLKKNKASELLAISHPLPRVNPKNDRSYCEVTRKGKKSVKMNGRFRFNFILFSSLYELFLTVTWVMRQSSHYDLYVGVDNLNCLWGLLLKRLGKVDKVVYYTIDYFPTRFSNRLLNSLYHYLDKVCVRYADETWNVSPQMVTARQKTNNMDPNLYNRQFTVPIGIWFKNTKRKSFNQIDKHTLIFVGHLLPHMGVDLAVRSLPTLLKKIPDIRLDIVGGGEEENHLKTLSKKLRLDKHIKFWGWIRDRKKLESILSNGAIGLAPFNTEILDEKVKNADPGKIKDYMQLGMPVIVTDAISTGKELEQHKCGIVIRYHSSDFIRAVLELSEDKTLREYRKNALSYVKRFDYNTIFGKNLERILT